MASIFNLPHTANRVDKLKNISFRNIGANEMEYDSIDTKDGVDDNGICLVMISDTFCAMWFRDQTKRFWSSLHLDQLYVLRRTHVTDYTFEK